MASCIDSDDDVQIGGGKHDDSGQTVRRQHDDAHQVESGVFLTNPLDPKTRSGISKPNQDMGREKINLKMYLSKLHLFVPSRIAWQVLLGLPRSEAEDQLDLHLDLIRTDNQLILKQ